MSDAVLQGLDGDPVRGILEYLRTLTAAIGKSSSIPDLFRAAFRHLSEQMPFDLAVAVTVEQNLHIYVSRRENGVHLIDERLVEEMKTILASHLAVSFDSTDVVTLGDFPDLPARELGDAMERKIYSMLYVDGRPSGVLFVCRGESEFTLDEQRLLDFFANQVAMLLGTVRVQEQVQNLADTDEMTGIWNRRYFRRQIEAEVERSRIYKVSLSLMMFDVDSFKEINDTFGHAMGDVVLSEMCGVVRESLRQPDLFARIGGDEFAILLPHTDHRGAEHLAQRILRKVRRMTIPGEANTAVTCSVSIGIGSYVPPDMSADELMRVADERLYHAKKNGKNRYA